MWVDPFHSLASLLGFLTKEGKLGFCQQRPRSPLKLHCGEFFRPRLHAAASSGAQCAPPAQSRRAAGACGATVFPLFSGAKKKYLEFFFVFFFQRENRKHGV